MGYACPVCEEPQADGEHLANHLAFSAMLGHADHADWLDEHAPDWDAEGPEELAERVAPHAAEVDLSGVTDEESDLPDPPGAAQGDRVEDAIARQSGRGRESLSPETRRVVEEAREMTRQRRAEAGDSTEERGESGEARESGGAGEPGDDAGEPDEGADDRNGK